MGRSYHQFSASELESVWQRWKRGEPNLQIAKAFCSHSVRVICANRHHESTPRPLFTKTKRPARGRNLGRGISIRIMGQGGVEPPTSRLSGVRSNHLSYWPC